MAFVFTVEDGTGLSNATAYVSVADADDILITNIHNDAWFALSETDKEKLLSWASKHLDRKVKWEGTKAVKTSALRWPRNNVVDIDGVEVEEDEIPQQLKEATAEMARFLVAKDRTVEQSRDGLKELIVDSVELVFDEKYRLPSVPSYINDLINGIGVVQSARRGFSKIVRS